MELQNKNRKFSMTDVEFKHWLGEVHFYLTKYLSDFSEFGLDQTKLDDFKSKIDYYNNFYDDIDFINFIREAVFEKDKAKSKVNQTISQMALRVKTKFGSDSAEFMRMNLNNIKSISEENLLNLSKDIHNQMVELLPDLLDYGLTQAMLDDYQILNENFENSLNAVKDKKYQRVVNTSQRIDLQNELYRIAAGWCNIGKNIYKEKNSIIYKNFVIFGTMKSYKLIPPANFKYDDTNLKITWEEVRNSTSYQLQSSLDGKNFEELYIGHEPFFKLKERPKAKTHFRVRARNSKGFGPFSEVITSNSDLFNQ